MLINNHISFKKIINNKWSILSKEVYWSIRYKTVSLMTLYAIYDYDIMLLLRRYHCNAIYGIIYPSNQSQ